MLKAMIPKLFDQEKEWRRLSRPTRMMVVAASACWLAGWIFQSVNCLGQDRLASSPPAVNNNNLALEKIFIWPDLAPGETTQKLGRLDNKRQDGIRRIRGISKPYMTAYPPERNASGTALVILPGGGFHYVVDNLEGTELVPFLNDLGITVFILAYRVSGDKSQTAWKKPTQDAQRAIRWIRHHKKEYAIDAGKIGIMGFSAGGQAAAATMTAEAPRYQAQDEIDTQPALPNFSMLIYPWKLENADGQLRPMIRVSESSPPTFIVHTHDDQTASSTGSAKLYLALKEHGIDAELHIYRRGGHGYGIRKRPGSTIDQWKDLATDWLRLKKLAP